MKNEIEMTGFLNKKPIPANPEKSKRLWLKFIWTAIPYLVFIGLVIFIIFNFVIIDTKKKHIEAQKKGLEVLEGTHIAIENAADVITIVNQSSDLKQAIDNLSIKLNLTKDQAAAVSMMRISEFTQDEKERVSKHILKINQDIRNKKENLPPDSPGVNVVTLELIPSLIRDKINLPGKIEPWVRLNVVAEVKGKVNKIYAVEGSYIKKGEIIARMDTRDYKNAYNSTKASYEVAQSSLKRYKELYKNQLSTKTQLDNAGAQVETLKAALDSAALNLERCTIKAPISGVVNRLYVEEGQFLNIAAKVIEVLQINKVKVIVGIPESDVDAVRKLKIFSVKIDALGGKVFKAKKYFLSNTADSMARSYNLSLVLENKKGEILPDMFARVEIVKKVSTDAIAIPLYSVISKNEEQLVFVEKESMVSRRKVELGFREGWMVVIEKGLEPGERVVVIGNRSIDDGQKVNVIRNITDIGELKK